GRRVHDRLKVLRRHDGRPAGVAEDLVLGGAQEARPHELDQRGVFSDRHGWPPRGVSRETRRSIRTLRDFSPWVRNNCGLSSHKISMRGYAYSEHHPYDPLRGCRRRAAAGGGAAGGCSGDWSADLPHCLFERGDPGGQALVDPVLHALLSAVLASVAAEVQLRLGYAAVERVLDLLQGGAL